MTGDSLKSHIEVELFSGTDLDHGIYWKCELGEKTFTLPYLYLYLTCRLNI